MTELLHAALSPVNLFFSILLIVILLYWMLVTLGALDLGSLDIEMDIDLDAEIEMEADLDTDIASSGSSWFINSLTFFNLGKVPFMIILTFLTLSMWTISILIDHHIGHGSLIFAAAMFIPNLFISLCITKIITTPLVSVFKSLNEGQKEINYIGLECKIILPATTTQLGQAEVNHNGNTLLLNIKVSEQNPTPLLKGDFATIVGQSDNLKHYLAVNYK